MCANYGHDSADFIGWPNLGYATCSSDVSTHVCILHVHFYV